MADPKRAAVSALRAASASVAIAGGLANTPHAWIADLAREAFAGAANVVDAGASWDDCRDAVVDAIGDVLEVVPHMRRVEARAIARGVGSAVSWVRRLVAA